MQDASKQTNYDIFINEYIYPDTSSIFKTDLKSLDRIKDSCCVVLDTSTLLLPYTIHAKTLIEIEEKYIKLSKEKRLYIPAQVAREFAKNRPNKIVEVYQQLLDKKSKVTKVEKLSYPLLEGINQYSQALETSDKLNHLINEYHSLINDITNEIKNWTWNDPVSQVYNKLFNSESIYYPQLNHEEIEKDLTFRNKYNIPPGYKDKTKGDKGIGDLLIWKTVLELGKQYKNDVIFVSSDTKADWWHRSGNQELYPRYELINEFMRVTDGKTLHIIKLSTLLNLYNLEKDIIEDIELQEEKTNDVYLEDLDLENLELAEPVCDNCNQIISDWQANFMIDKNEFINGKLDSFRIICKRCTRQLDRAGIGHNYHNLLELVWLRDKEQAEQDLENILQFYNPSQNFVSKFKKLFL